MRFITIILAMLTIGLAAGCEAQARIMQCGDRTALLKVLNERYQEKPRALGLSSTGKAMFEVYTSKTGTWTIIMTTTAGLTCVMAAGHSWEETTVLPGEPS